MESKRYQFKNEFNSFTSVFIYVGPDKTNFIAEVTVRIKNDDGTERIKINQRKMPIDLYKDFLMDLQNRANIANVL